MKVSKDFYREEFACGCGCGFDTVDVELLEVLQDVRDIFNTIVTINSACRCVFHNAGVGGADHSKHLLGIAADIVVTGVDPMEIYQHLSEAYPHKYGVGNYETFTHIDVRSNRGRW